MNPLAMLTIGVIGGALVHAGMRGLMRWWSGETDEERKMRETATEILEAMASGPRAEAQVLRRRNDELTARVKELEGKHD